MTSKPVEVGQKVFVLIFAQPKCAAQLSKPVEVKALFYPALNGSICRFLYIKQKQKKNLYGNLYMV